VNGVVNRHVIQTLFIQTQISSLDNHLSETISTAHKPYSENQLNKLIHNSKTLSVNQILSHAAIAIIPHTILKHIFTYKHSKHFSDMLEASECLSNVPSAQDYSSDCGL